MKPNHMNRYHIYVISKGRADVNLTYYHLEKYGADYSVVIEAPEWEDYAKRVPEEKLLVLPWADLGEGSIPARNFCWEHSMEQGAKRHWVLDDNIGGFYRYHENKRIRVSTPVAFRVLEDWADRFENMVMVGHQYLTFVPQRVYHPPLILNTRVYSSILLQNDTELFWRGRYNEDTDLSLRALKAGYCTALFNSFLADKKATGTVRGGNTDTVYAKNWEDKRLRMAKSLQQQHPEQVQIKRKWGRWQHVVSYREFKGNQPIYAPDYDPDAPAIDYGLTLRMKEEVDGRE